MRKPPVTTKRGGIAFLAVLLIAGCGGDDSGYPNDPGADGIPAATRPGEGPFRALVTFTVDHPDSDPYSYAVACEGDVSQLQGAADIDADAACAALATGPVQQRLIDGPAADRVCTQVYGGPDTATAHGNINGRLFEASFDRRDGCGISDWDDLFGDLLIDARGDAE